MDADQWDEQVGSVADEAARLLESLRRAAREAVPPEGAAPAGAEREPHGRAQPDEASAGATPGVEHDPFCQWCPLCRSAAVVRSLSPETLARLADLAAVAASVLADLAAGREHPAQQDHPDRGDGSGRPPPRNRPASPPAARPVPVVDIEVSEEAPHG